MITPYTIQELHLLAHRVEALQHRVEDEVTGSAHELRDYLTSSKNALLAATREAEEMARAQYHKK